MKYVSPTRAVTLALLCALGLNHFAAAGQAPPQPQAPPPRQRPKLKDFGSSLKRLRWDEKKKAAVEKGGRPGAKGDAGDEEVVRVETDLVVCDVLVLDERGSPVRGLTREDFVVTEDGRTQRVELFAPGGRASVPRSIVLVIDYSGSQSPYLRASVEAAKALADQLGPADRMAVVTDDVKLLADFTADKKLLKERLDSLRTRADSYEARHGWFTGHSLQYSALLAALRELFDEEDIRPVVIFQTDGDQLATLRGAEGGPPTGGLKEQFSLEDIYRAAERSRATVYCVIPGRRLIGLPPEERVRRARAGLEEMRAATAEESDDRAPVPWRDRHARKSVDAERRDADWLLKTQTSLAGLAALTGGWTDFLEDPSHASAIYSRILSDMTSRYAVGYYPTNRERDGGRRAVRVEVRGHPEYRVLGRKSYYAPGPDE